MYIKHKSNFEAVQKFSTFPLSLKERLSVHFTIMFFFHYCSFDFLFCIRNRFYITFPGNSATAIFRTIED